MSEPQFPSRAPYAFQHVFDQATITDPQIENGGLDHSDSVPRDTEASNATAIEDMLADFEFDISEAEADWQNVLQKVEDAHQDFKDSQLQISGDHENAFNQQDEADQHHNYPHDPRFQTLLDSLVCCNTQRTSPDFMNMLVEHPNSDFQSFVPLLDNRNGVVLGHEMDLLHSALEPTVHAHQGVYSDEASKMSAAPEGSFLEHNFSVLDPTSQRLSQDEFNHGCNIVSPTPFSASISRKRTGLPADFAEDETSTPTAKRFKVAHMSNAPQESLLMESFFDQEASENNFQLLTASSAPPSKQPGLQPLCMAHIDSMLAPLLQINHQGSETPAPSAPAGRLLFANYTQAQQAAANRQIPHNWLPVQNDVSLPLNDYHRSVYVRMLVRAFEDTSKCIHSGKTETSQSRRASLAGGNSVQKQRQTEAVCWQIVRIAEKLHTQGPISLRIFDEAKFKDIKKFQHLTFEARLAHVCELLRLSKSRCESLLKLKDLHAVVAAPSQLITQARWNKKQNTDRQQYLAAGRMALEEDAMDVDVE